MITTRPLYDSMTDAQRLALLNKLEMDNANLGFRLREVDPALQLSDEARRLIALGRELSDGRAA